MGTDQRYNKYKYNFLKYYDALSWHDRKMFRKLLAEETKIPIRTFEKYLYLKRSASEDASGSFLIILSKAFSSILKVEISPEDFYNEPPKGLSESSLKIFEVVTD